LRIGAPNDDASLSFQNLLRFIIGILKHNTFSHPPQNVGKVLEAALIPPPDILLRDIVAPSRYAFTDALDAAFGIVHAHVYQIHNESARLGLQNSSQSTST